MAGFAEGRQKLKDPQVNKVKGMKKKKKKDLQSFAGMLERSRASLKKYFTYSSNKLKTRK